MNNRQEDRLTMYLAVRSACERHSAVWQTFTAFANAYEDFDTQVNLINTIAEQQDAGITGARIDKIQRRDSMTVLAVQVGNALEAFASVQNDATLAGKVRVLPSTFTHSRDTEARQIASRIHAEATKRAAAMVDYGVSAQKLADLATAIAAFDALLTAPQNLTANTINKYLEFKARGLI